MPSIQYGTTTIDYQIIYKENKKDISILIEYQIGVTVIAVSYTHLDVYKRQVTIFYVSWFNTFKSKDTSVKKEVVLG